MYADEFSIYAGERQPPLAERICRYLKTDLGAVEVFQFANENIFVRVMENVREQDVFLVQPTSRLNGSIMELLIMIDASSWRPGAHHRGHSVLQLRPLRQEGPAASTDHRAPHRRHADRRRRRSSPDDGPPPGPDPGLQHPGRRVTAVNLICAHIKAKELDDIVVVSELGFAKKARNFAELLHAPLAIVEKRRLGNEDRTEVMNVIGEVGGRKAVIIDDEIDTAGLAHGGRGRPGGGGRDGIYSCATHGIFSGDALDRIKDSPITEIVVTDTVPLPPGADDPRLDGSFGRAAVRRGHQAHPPRRERRRAVQLRGPARRGDDVLG